MAPIHDKEKFASRPRPHNGSGIELARRQRSRSMERTNSMGLMGGPVSPSAKLPTDFRTLSIHVHDTMDGRPDLDVKKNRDVTDLSELEWHSLPTSEVCTRLQVSPKRGLDGQMASRRLSKFGKNVISPPPKRWWRKLLKYFFGGFGTLLLIGAIICFLAWKPLGEPPQASNLALAVVLLIVILVQAIFNAWQDFSTSRVMSSIKSMLPADVLVTRDGDQIRIPASDLVLGDVVTISLGAKVPADVRLLDVSSDLRFDRSILTGESVPISGSVDTTDGNFMESRNIALQGTLCTSGSGIGVCVGLGDNTVFGRIAKSASRDRPGMTTLEIEILRFVLVIAGLALVVAVFIAVLWGAWLRRDHPGFINVPTLLVDCVSVMVAFIPEGLPICVTLSLTVIAHGMYRANVLCKSLSTVESLGAVNIIASDKTGTLTQNKMTVSNIAIGEARYSSADAKEMAVKGGSEGQNIQILAAVSALCNDAVFDASTVDMPVELRQVNGDATDTGLLRFAENILPTAGLRTLWEEVGKIAFNSKNKFAIKLFRTTNSDDAAPMPVSSSEIFYDADYLFLVKGAPDILSRRCSHYVDQSGQVTPFDSDALAYMQSIQEDFASRGQRVLLLAKKIIIGKELNKEIVSDINQLEEHLLTLNQGLTVVGLVALVDPPRHDTEETVRICRRAGIRFAMVTGDFATTATAIARQVGIVTTQPSELKHLTDLPHDKPLDQIAMYDDTKEYDDPVCSLVLSGAEMITMTESQWKQALAFDELVFARTSPQQKLQIVRLLQAAGCTVAVTGDGVNDAPALKQADVGVAIAGGSEVAMEAADLILLNEFSSIVTGIKYGRLCFENLRKTILYLLPAGSFSELMPVLFNVLTGVPQALSNIQMIIICAATDVLPALSLVMEQPEADLLLRKPRDRKKDRLASWKLICHAYLFLGVLESLTSFIGAFFFGFKLQNGIRFSQLWLKYNGTNIDPVSLIEFTSQAQSIYFFNLVVMQWFNLLATRTRRLSIFQQNPITNPVTRNLYLFPAMLCALAIGCFFSYVDFFQRVFGTRGVKAQYYFLPMAYGIGMLAMDEMRKWWVRKYPKGLLAKVAW
ncbi:calcium ATPase [Pluteus cervinus]|uniref:Calcium ATPase n=1 Tax=Pluteus cervinus TaxID=181527 RepID=A0ACD3A2M1_9AGAR|nr:calcium ATPase [Pluteus cervinus]